MFGLAQPQTWIIAIIAAIVATSILKHILSIVFRREFSAIETAEILLVVVFAALAVHGLIDATVVGHEGSYYFATFLILLFALCGFGSLIVLIIYKRTS